MNIYTNVTDVMTALGPLCVATADAVGFYGSMSSSIPKLYQLAALYKSAGALTIAGGKHIEFLPTEALANDVDIAVRGEGEQTIVEILRAWETASARADHGARLAIESSVLAQIKGIAYLVGGHVTKTPERPLR